jgi:surface antigen
MFGRSARTPLIAPTRGGGRGGGGYPDADAVDCSAQYGIYSWCKGGTWISPRRFAYRNCTDFVAWFLDLTWGSFGFPAGTGNAADWRAYAGNAGLSITGVPSVGDVAWWGSEVAGGFGHVGIVTAVASNGSVSIAEYNGDGHGDYDIRPNMRADAYLHPRSGGGAPGGGGAGSGGGGSGSGGGPGAPGGPPSREYVWGHASDNGIYEDIWNGSAWSGFNLLAPNLGGDPVVVGTGTGQEVWARGTNGEFYENIWNGSSWGGFQALSSETFQGDPVVQGVN